MNPIEILETFGLPLAMCIFLGYGLYRQSLWVQKDLKADLKNQAERLEQIVIGLINAQKKLQTDFGRELARLEGSQRGIIGIIKKLSGGIKRKK